MRDSYCIKCARKLEPRARLTGQFDSASGLPTENQWLVCPNWRTVFWIGTGHTWTHVGVNLADGAVHPWGSDPMIHENPPRPPVGVVG